MADDLLFRAEMVIKEKEPITSTIAELERLLLGRGLSASQREELEDEVGRVRGSNKGERDAAYFIDFELGQAKNYAVLHDLRIEHEGRVAQIDHLIIGRFLDIILIESKNISTAVRFNAHGEFEVKTRYGWKGMMSPVEQNRRHAAVLGDFLKASKLLPTRLGFQILPSFHEWVLIAPQCSLSSKRDPKTEIIKMDMFGARMKAWREKAGDDWKMAKVISAETLQDFGKALAAQHRPINFDYAAKFGVRVEEDSASYIPAAERPMRPRSDTLVDFTGRAEAAGGISTSPQVCASCRAPVEAKVATYCRLNSKRFKQKLYCRACQEGQTSTCEGCAAPVESKVVAFCRFNSRRFGKRILCRECQSVPVGTA